MMNQDHHFTKNFSNHLCKIAQNHLVISIGILALFFFSFPVFAQKPIPTLFKVVPGTESGINFANVLKESPGLNIVTYEYFYNGAGVGLGDTTMTG